MLLLLLRIIMAKHVSLFITKYYHGKICITITKYYHGKILLLLSSTGIIVHCLKDLGNLVTAMRPCVVSLFKF